MYTVRLFLYTALLGSLALFLIACDDDPSGVGVGVGPDPLDGGAPVTVDLLPATIDADRVAPVSGGIGTQSPARFFAGRVDDPSIGITNANGFLDVIQPANVAASFVEGPVTGAFLRLQPVSVYGDTTNTVTLALYDMPEPWDAEEVRSDTTLASSDLITTFSFSPTEDEVLVPLPDAWIEENDATLRDTTDGGQAFLDAFAGFRMAHESGNAAVGFNRTESELGVITDDDTTNFVGQKSLTTVDRDEEANIPDDRVLVHGGVGQFLTFAFDFDSPPLDTLRGTPVNRAEFVVPVDESFFADTPDGFVRPQASSYTLTGIATEDGTEVGLANNIDSAAGNVRITGANALQVFEDSFLREPPFQRFNLTSRGDADGDGEFSLGVAVLRSISLDADSTVDVENSTRAVVTVTPF